MNITWIQAGVLFFLALLAVVEGRTIILENTDTFGADISGWYVIMLGSLLALLTIYYCFTAGKISPQKQSGEPGETKKAKLLILLLIAYVLAIEYLGYALSSVLFMGIFFRLQGKYSWRKVAMLSLGLGISFSLIFSVVGMSLPTGFLPFP